MDVLIHYDNCPVCGSRAIGEKLKARDYTVSQKEFLICECGDCGLRFTQDVPDAATIGPYYKSEDYISHTNTAKGLVNSLYQQVRKYTLGQKRRLVKKQTGLSKGRLLDLGCGTGAFVHEMQQYGWDVTGLEPDADARKVGAAQFGVQLESTEQFYALPPGRFDAITLWHVLEHVHELHAYVMQLKNLLTENGKLFIAVPNYTSREAGVYKEYWAAYDVPRHLYHFAPSSMERLMQQHGLKVNAYKPMWFDSFYISMLSSKYKNGKTNFPGAAWNGLLSNIKALFNAKKCSSVIYVIGRGK